MIVLTNSNYSRGEIVRSFGVFKREMTWGRLRAGVAAGTFDIIDELGRADKRPRVAWCARIAACVTNERSADTFSDVT